MTRLRGESLSTSLQVPVNLNNEKQKDVKMRKYDDDDELQPPFQESNNDNSGGRQGQRQVWLGGPGTMLPFWLESSLSWMLALSCLSVALYHWMMQMLLVPMRKIRRNIQEEGLLALPLMTHSRYELQTVSPVERYQQLIQYLKMSSNDDKPVGSWTNDELIQKIQQDSTARRLTSLVMIHKEKLTLQYRYSNKDCLDLIQRLESFWPQLVQIPISSAAVPVTVPVPVPDHDYLFELSVIIPAYKENGEELYQKLQLLQQTVTYNHANKGQNGDDMLSTIQVIVVHAGRCSKWDLISSLVHKDTKRHKFGNLTVCEFPPLNNSNKDSPNHSMELSSSSPSPSSSLGRGPCLNFGAFKAQGRILCFLHADTRLITGWNLAILQAFANSTEMANACAFSFAIDDTPNMIPPIPGIKAIQTTANWRTQWFHLPYGDQCICIPRNVFDYIGGFPHQCLLEDYELVRLIRHRAAVLPNETLRILKLPAYCSPRRWQKLGVLYVTWTNSKIINQYSQGKITPDELYQIYYNENSNNNYDDGDDDDDDHHDDINDDSGSSTIHTANPVAIDHNNRETAEDGIKMLHKLLSQRRRRRRKSPWEVELEGLFIQMLEKYERKSRSEKAL